MATRGGAGENCGCPILFSRFAIFRTTAPLLGHHEKTSAFDVPPPREKNDPCSPCTYANTSTDGSPPPEVGSDREESIAVPFNRQLNLPGKRTRGSGATKGVFVAPFFLKLRDALIAVSRLARNCRNQRQIALKKIPKFRLKAKSDTPLLAFCHTF